MTSTLTNNCSRPCFTGYAPFIYAAVMTVLVGQASPAATTILDTQGFEGYSVGALQGQLADARLWQTVGDGGSSATVTNSVGVAGSKGVQVNRALRSDDWWGVTYTGAGFPTSRYVFIDWDMKVNNTGAGAGVQGPFMGVESYDDANIPKLLGSLGVDATTRDVMYVDPGTGFLTETGLTVDNNWHHYQIRLDFAGDLYSTSVDNDSPPLQPIAFVGGPSSTFSDADIAAFAGGADNDSQRQTATAFFDNFIVRQIAPGDYNFDGTVDAADYVIWRDNAEALQPSLVADGDGNGVVNQADYAIWRGSFASTAPAFSAANSIVPEPSTIALAVCGFIFVCWRSENYRNL